MKLDWNRYYGYCSKNVEGLWALHAKALGNTVTIPSTRPSKPVIRHSSLELQKVTTHSGETLETLDGVDRELAKAGRGLGDTGEDCVIIDGDDHVLGLAGIMGGASSEISESTTDVLVEAAFFDPMTIARSSKRHGLRSEASNRFERGVDPNLALRAVGRFVAVLSESVPDLEWMAAPLDISGKTPELPVVELRENDIERTLGVAIPVKESTTILEGLGFSVSEKKGSLFVTPPSSRLDIRSGANGRADVIEEIARVYSYRRLPRRSPSWPTPGGLSQLQQFRRKVRDVCTWQQ